VVIFTERCTRLVGLRRSLARLPAATALLKNLVRPRNSPRKKKERAVEVPRGKTALPLGCEAAWRGSNAKGDAKGRSLRSLYGLTLRPPALGKEIQRVRRAAEGPGLPPVAARCRSPGAVAGWRSAPTCVTQLITS